MRRGLIFSIFLTVATLAVYGQVLGFDFVSWDDPGYVAKNAHMQGGLTREGLVWVLTSQHGGHWHPVTGLSHMLDCQLFGLSPSGHHLTSVLLHIANALLLFGLLRSMTGAFWRSAIVATLFALHPLQVESVAWVSERKNVLSTCLGLLSLWAYVGYARSPSTGRYALTAAIFALGLMAKSMLVTLPLLFLLVDVWPLGRMQSATSRLGLVVEKIPLFALSAISSVITFGLVRHDEGHIIGGEILPLHLRVANAVVGYVRYLGKMIWPTDLAVLYPHPNLTGGTPLTASEIIGAVAVLLAISAVITLVVRERYGIVGWLWYLTTLLPVIGLVQVGQQSMADRYAYVPLIGIFILIAWGGAELLARWQNRPVLPPAFAVAMAAVVVGTGMACTWAQAAHWRDSVALYERALAVSPRLPVMHTNLGVALDARGERDAAIQHFQEALDIEPDYVHAHYNLGNTLSAVGDRAGAVNHYRQALELKPDFVRAHTSLGDILREDGTPDAAMEHYQEALRLDPTYAPAHEGLGSVFLGHRRFDAAMHHYRLAIEHDPGLSSPHNNLGVALAMQGRFAESVPHFRDAIRVDPGFRSAHDNLARALRMQQDRAAANH
jgi:Flp pilus assembly protein TadD